MLWPKIRVLLGGTVKNTGRLIGILPGVFRELSGVVFRFIQSRSLTVHVASSEDIKI